MRVPFRPTRFHLAIALLVVCALGGGASRAATLSLLYLRPLVVMLLIGVLLIGKPLRLDRVRVPLLLLAGLMLWTTCQLVPLPSQWWTALPVRDQIAAGLQAIDQPLGWRPLSLTPELTLNSLLSLIVPVAMLVAAASLSSREHAWLAIVVVAVAVASILVEVAQIAGGPYSPFHLYSVSNIGTPSGLFANRNHQAVFLACALPLATIPLHPRFAGRRNRSVVWMCLTFVLMSFVAIIATGSRSGTLIALPLLGYTLSVSVAHVAPNRKWSLGLKIAAVAASVAIAVLMLVFGRALSFDRLGGFDAASEQRIKALPTLWSMIEQLFTTGSGFGSFDPVFRFFEPDPLLHATFFNHAHNDWIELAITGGLPALALLAAFVVWVAITTIHRFRDEPTLANIIARCGGLAVMALGCASFTDYPLRTPLMAMLIALACAWLADAGKTEV